MLYRWLADVVVIGHLLFVGFVVWGGLLIWRWPKAAWIHVPAACWAVAIEWMGGICPLTPLESWLRGQGGHPVADGDFLGRFILPVLYPAGLTWGVQVLLGTSVLAINVAVYGVWWCQYRSKHSLEL